MSTTNKRCYENAFFTIQHCDDCHIAGHLIIVPKTQVFSMAEMSTAALQNLGDTIARAHQVVNKVIKPERIYTLSFSELMPALHFHIFPRTAALLEHFNLAHQSDTNTANGPLLFDWARRQYKEDKMADYSLKIKNINELFMQ